MILSVFKSKYRNVFVGFIALAGGLALFNVASTQSVMACSTVNTGNVHSYAGIVIDLQVKRNPQNGNRVEQYNHTGAQVNVVITTVNPSSNPGNVVKLGNGAEGVAERYARVAFRQTANSCGEGGASIVLGGHQPINGRPADVPTSVTSNGNSGYWALDCDASKRGIGNEQPFHITAIGDPVNYRSGGSWTAVNSTAPPNGFTTRNVKLVYHEPPDPPLTGWRVYPYSAGYINGQPLENWSLVNKGDAGVFMQHSAQRDSSHNTTSNATASKKKVIQYKLIRLGDIHTVWKDIQGPWSNPVPNPKGSWFGPETSHNFASISSSANLQPNEAYCERIHVDHASGNTPSDTTGPEDASNAFCVVIQPQPPKCWELIPETSVGRGWVEKGDSIGFNHQLTATGDCQETASGFSHSINYSGNYNQPPRGLPGQAMPPRHIINTPDVLTTNGSTGLGSQYCQQYAVNPSFWIEYQPNGPQQSGPPRGADPRCVTVVGGRTTVTPGNVPGTIEPGESVTFTGGYTTNNFVGAEGYPGYPLNCSWWMRVNSTNYAKNPCGTTVTGNGSHTPINYTTTGNNIGDRICLIIEVTPYRDFVIGSTAEKCVNVVAKPYMKAYGGDVMAGYGYNTGNLCSRPASIFGWSRGAASGDYRAAGAQYAAFAKDKIQQFATNAVNTPAAPQTLAFNNNVNVNLAAGSFGGGYTTGMCLPDYFSAQPSSFNGTYPGSTALTLPFGDTASVDNQFFKINGNASLGGTIWTGQSRTLYVDGDLTITSDITADTQSHHGMFLPNDASLIPRLDVYVRGNIYVSPGVKQLYGRYFAQSKTDGTTGHIYTCAIAATPLSGGRYGQCTSQLTVTGSFTAQKIHFQRTHSTRSSASNFAYPDSQAAEVFVYNPLLYIRDSVDLPGGTPGAGGGGGVGTYDAITTLPPVL